MNPLLSQNKEVLNVDKLIFEPLITIDENYKIELCLASECSKTSKISYVIKVDQSKEWQDSNKICAKDVQFTIDRLKEGKSVYSSNVEKIASVDLLDENTVKINLIEEVPFFEYNLTFPILPSHYYELEDFNTSSKIPIGTGMYKIEGIDATNITLKKNENWWKKEKINSKIETIQIKKYAEIGELYNSFKLGNIDIFTTSNLNLEQYIGTIGYAKTEFKGREFDYLAFNCEDDILKNIEVRRAISYAIDKANIVSSIYNNQYEMANFPLDYGHYLYKNTGIGANYDLEQAKNILTNGGWEYKNNRWQKVENYRTTRINLTLTVQTENEKRIAVAENIKSSLEQIGIKVTIKKVTQASYEKILESKNYQMIVTGVYNSYSPDLTYFFGKDNLEHYQNGEINQIIEEVKTIKDENLLKEKYARILEIYNREQPFIGLYRNKISVIKSQNLAGEVIGNNYFSYYRLENWHRI